MSAEENKEVVRRFWGVWEEGNIGLVDELLAPDYVNHSPGMPGQPAGPDGVKAIVSMFRSGMPDLKVVIDDMIAEGDKVAVRYTIEGTHEGDLFGVPPTGHRVSIESFTVERVSDGRIREHWRVTDTLDMMQQLEAIPTPEHAHVEDG
ncbi:ester cyclase [soil metagenome]